MAVTGTCPPTTAAPKTVTLRPWSGWSAPCSLSEQDDQWAVTRGYMTMVTLLFPPGREGTSGEEVLLQAAS